MGIGDPVGEKVDEPLPPFREHMFRLVKCQIEVVMLVGRSPGEGQRGKDYNDRNLEGEYCVEHLVH